MSLKPLRCLLGFHDWHEHTVFNPPYRIPTPPHVTEICDRTCLICGHDDLRAGRRFDKDERRTKREMELERKLRERREES